MKIPPDFRKPFCTIILWGIAIFLALNAFSWQPGYGGRHDKKPGMEVERYFGWPACFRAELWRSDHPHEFFYWNYVPPIPLTSEMYFVYSSNSLLALCLNATLVACVTTIVLFMKWVEVRGIIRIWIMIVGIVLAIVSIVIVKYGDGTSAYL